MESSVDGVHLTTGSLSAGAEGGVERIEPRRQWSSLGLCEDLAHSLVQLDRERGVLHSVLDGGECGKGAFVCAGGSVTAVERLCQFVGCVARPRKKGIVRIQLG